MRSIHIRISHDNDLVIPELLDVKIRLFHTRTQSRNDQTDLLALQDLIEARLLDIEDLAFKGKHSLKSAVSGLFGRTPCRIALHEKDLTLSRISLLAVCQLTGERGGFEDTLAASQLSGFPRCLPCPGRFQDFQYNLLSHRWIFFKIARELLVDDGVNDTLDIAVSQFGFCLAFELRIFQLEAQHDTQALPGIIPAQVLLQVLDQVVCVGILIERAGQG